MKLLDLTGERFGRLTVIERAENRITPNGSVRTMWRCRCDCGNEIECSSQNLKASKIASCGCWRSELTSERKLEDLTGQKFGRLTVIERAETTNVSTRWKCKCDCGNECVVLAQNLKKGHTLSCGCYREEVRPTLRLKHGYKKTKKRAYSVWEKLKARCCNENNPSYPRYGGRGIFICEEWKDNPDLFIDWLYSQGYDENANYGENTVDRINNNDGYYPENCRLADAKGQANNRRTNRIIEHNGEKKTLAQWRDFLGISQSKAYYHLVEKGRTIQELIDKCIV